MIFTIIVTILVLQMVVAVVLRVAVAFRRRPKPKTQKVFFLYMSPPGCARGMGEEK